MEQAATTFDFRAHLARQRTFSESTFGPGARTAGVLDHIGKELREIKAAPTDLSEWIDVVILALDGAWRAGYSPDQIIDALTAKQAKNEARTWPDWRAAPQDKAIEHQRVKQTRCYLAGPMTGIKDWNFPAFNQAAASLRASGYEVINPVEINSDTTMKWEDCMRADIAQLVTCDQIALLPGWEKSKGASLEAHIASRLGMRPIYVNLTQGA